MRRSALLIAVAVLAGCGEEEPKPKPASTPTTTVPAPKGPALLMGLSEANATLLGAPVEAPPEMAPWRDRVADLGVGLYRIGVDWAALQPDPGKPATLDAPADGCLRGMAPCGAYAGIRDQLRAMARRRVQGMVVLYGVPEWAAAPPGGCERPGLTSRSRPISEDGLRAYQDLVGQVAEAARDAGADLRWWSVWNEPNLLFFVSPQRGRCSTDSKPVSPVVYTRLARAMRAALDEAPGEQKLAVGELAGVASAGPRGSGVEEFLRAVPDDVVCRADVIAQHAYVQARSDAIAAVTQAVSKRRCGREIPIWITETGVGAPRAGTKRDTSPAALRAQCRIYHRQLRSWARNPRIQAIVHYTYREDPAFPVGLADAALTQEYPVADLIRSWAKGDRSLPASC